MVAFVPLALGIGVDPAVILAFASACYGYYILPTYPSDLAAIQFDRSGTTHIGKFVINHSFIFTGLNRCNHFMYLWLHFHKLVWLSIINSLIKEKAIRLNSLFVCKVRLNLGCFISMLYLTLSFIKIPQN